MVDMEFVFQEAFGFDQPLNWDVSLVTTVEDSFREASVFNGDIVSTNTSIWISYGINPTRNH